MFWHPSIPLKSTTVRRKLGYEENNVYNLSIFSEEVSPEKCLKETLGIILTMDDALAIVAARTLIHLPCTSRFCSSYITLCVSSVHRGIVVGGSVGINAQARWRKRIHEHVRCTYLRRWRRMRQKKNTRRRYEWCGRTRSAYENRRLIAAETRNTRVSLSSSCYTGWRCLYNGRRALVSQ